MSDAGTPAGVRERTEDFARQAVRHAAKESLSRYADGRRHTKHHITNLSVRMVDGRSALACSYYLLAKDVEGRLSVEASGRYDTWLALTWGQWGVRAHRFSRDLTRA